MVSYDSCLVLPEVYDHLLRLCHIQLYVIVGAPVNHPLNFFSVGWLVSVGYQSFNGGIIRELEYQSGAATGPAVTGEECEQ